MTSCFDMGPRPLYFDINVLPFEEDCLSGGASAKRQVKVRLLPIAPDTIRLLSRTERLRALL